MQHIRGFLDDVRSALDVAGAADRYGDVPSERIEPVDIDDDFDFSFMTPLPDVDFYGAGMPLGIPVHRWTTPRHPELASVFGSLPLIDLIRLSCASRSLNRDSRLRAEIRRRMTMTPPPAMAHRG